MPPSTRFRPAPRTPAAGRGLSRDTEGPLSGRSGGRTCRMGRARTQCLRPLHAHQPRSQCPTPRGAPTKHAHRFSPGPTLSPSPRGQLPTPSSSNQRGPCDQTTRSAPPKAAPSFPVTTYEQVKARAIMSDGEQANQQGRKMVTRLQPVEPPRPPW